MSSFEEIMGDNDFSDFESNARVLSRSRPDTNEVLTMVKEIHGFVEMHGVDPTKAEDYRRFLSRSWREFGYTNEEIAEITAQAIRIIGDNRNGELAE